MRSIQYFLARWTRSPKENSQAYILMTLMPLMISSMSLIRLSDLPAVSSLKRENTRPIQPSMRG